MANTTEFALPHDLVLPSLSPPTITAAQDVESSSVRDIPERLVEEKGSAHVAPAPSPSPEPVLSPKLIARLEVVAVLYETLPATDHYALLGVAYNANGKEIRSAYFKLSKQFHPDVFFRQPIGEHRRKLEIIFDAMTRAYDTLRSETARAEYDAAHGIVAPAREAVVPSAPKVVSLRPPHHSVPPRVETERERAERIARQRDRLMRGLRPSQPKAPSQPNAPSQPRLTPSQARAPSEVTGPPAEPTTGTTASREAQEALLRELTRRGRDPSRTTGTLTRSSALQGLPTAAEAPMLALAAVLDSEDTGINRWAAARLRDAYLEEKAGHVLDAANILRMALERFPDPRLQVEVDRLNHSVIVHTAQNLRTLARAAERSRDFAVASKHWKKIANGLRDDMEAHLQAARTLFETGAVGEAGRFALRAAELAPDEPAPREVLIAFFEKVGMELNAKRERAILKRILAARSA